jgi:hypothetical protein
VNEQRWLSDGAPGLRCFCERPRRRKSARFPDDGTDRIALAEEARAIQEELDLSGHRDKFELVTRWAVRFVTLYNAGQALSALVTLPDGKHILVDASESPTRPGCGAPCQRGTNA